jgi:endogenous inhibitor of DNA gyrase (YacG/DUF329 family)
MWIQHDSTWFNHSPTQAALASQVVSRLGSREHSPFCRRRCLHFARWLGKQFRPLRDPFPSGNLAFLLVLKWPFSNFKLETRGVVPVGNTLRKSPSRAFCSNTCSKRQEWQVTSRLQVHHGWSKWFICPISAVAMAPLVEASVRWSHGKWKLKQHIQGFQYRL